ncbi:MAG: methionyl-tRNA formyltransferase [Burkholderiaceae bacterium]|nr:methionyl-tRNA formyltransferase [Burkholderiaceae bacterium]
MQTVSRHSDVDCTYTVVHIDGQKYLQLDTYGSITRENPGKKSQSLRLTPQAIQQLKSIIQQHGL